MRHERLPWARIVMRIGLQSGSDGLRHPEHERRKFEPTDKWMETKGLVEKVVDDARKINQVVARGSYGAEAARLWAVLRTGINDLARAYGVPPMAI